MPQPLILRADGVVLARGDWIVLKARAGEIQQVERGMANVRWVDGTWSREDCQDESLRAFAHRSAAVSNCYTEEQEGELETW